jgi:hypothetical protein
MLKVFLLLVASHAAVCISAIAGWLWAAPIAAASVYAPLYALQSLGLPVLGRAPSGGWAAPSILGGVLVLSIWVLVWGLLAWVIAVVLRGPRSHGA